MRRAEIWLIDIPDRGGHEQRGTRPALILVAHTQHMVTIIPFTSQQRAARFPHTLLINATKANGLDSPSILLIYQLGGIDKRRLLHKLGTLEKGTMSAVEGGLKKYLHLS